MAVPQKYERLLKAMLRFNTFNLVVDLIALALFAIVSVATANKLLPKKLVDLDFFNWSWRIIGVCAFILFILLSTQLSKKNRQRILSAFQKEAAIKAARKNNFRKPRNRP